MLIVLQILHHFRHIDGLSVFDPLTGQSIQRQSHTVSVIDLIAGHLFRFAAALAKHFDLHFAVGLRAYVRRSLLVALQRTGMAAVVAGLSAWQTTLIAVP